MDRIANIADVHRCRNLKKLPLLMAACTADTLWRLQHAMTPEDRLACLNRDMQTAADVARCQTLGQARAILRERGWM